MGRLARFVAGLAYYAQATPSRASDFRQAVEQAAALALAFPDAGQFDMGARKIVVRRFPFSLIYQPEANGILIIALSITRVGQAIGLGAYEIALTVRRRLLQAR